MGRTGGGSSSSHRSSGGGHSFSRSSGGHRVGGSSSSRTGSGSSRSSSRSYSGSRHNYGYGGSYINVGRSYGYGSYVGRSFGFGGYGSMRPAGRIMSSIVTLIMCIVVLACIFLMYTSIKQPKNYTERIKLETSNTFDNNCVIDELGWFDNSRNTAASIQKFWKETGVQPYIILRADDGTLTTDAEKDAWLQNYYQTNIAPREDAFVYCYFYENGEESSGIPSYMGYTSGYQASSVMDAEAVDIFWGYIDRYWVSDMSTDDMFIQAFNNTGKVIMKVSTTGKDLVKYLIILVITVIVSVVLLKLAKVWFKDRREKAKEDERVLNTKVSDMAKPTDPLEDKYLN